MEDIITKIDIEFIDTYLRNTGILYEDIRIELVDQIAAEIEYRMSKGDSRGFYEVFKDYMIAHKTTLLKENNKPFHWRIFKNLVRKFLKNLYSWQVILGSIICFWVFEDIYSFFHTESAIRSFFPTLLMIMVMLIPSTVFGKKRFSFIGHFGILVTVFFSLNYYIIPYINQPSILYYGYLGLMAFLFVSSLKTMISLVIFYKKRFLIV